MSDKVEVTEAVATPEPENAALEAFSKGVEATGKAPEPVSDTKKVDEDNPKPAVTEPEKEQPEKPEKDAEDDDPDAQIEKEIKDRGLKADSAARFRELAKRPDEETFAKVQALAERAEQWETTVRNTGASPEQFQNALAYLTAINSGDPKNMSAVYDQLVNEVKWLGERLGKELPGIHDPLNSHPDLKQDVEDGAITRARALELANQRALNARNDEFRSRAEQEQQQRALVNRVVTVDIQALNDKLQASDAQYEQKLAMLTPTLQFIRKTLPPQQWAAAIEEAYRALPIIPAPAPKPATVPLRPTGNNANTMVSKPKTALEAFQMGVEALRA